MGLVHPDYFGSLSQPRSNRHHESALHWGQSKQSLHVECPHSDQGLQVVPVDQFEPDASDGVGLLQSQTGAERVVLTLLKAVN